MSKLTSKKAVVEEPREAHLDENGHEVVSSVPVAPPLGYKKQPTMVEHIRNLVRSEHLRVAAEAAGQESFEEADDFEVGDDFDPSSPYEEVFDPPVDPSGAVVPAPAPPVAPAAPPSGGPPSSTAVVPPPPSATPAPK